MAESAAEVAYSRARQRIKEVRERAEEELMLNVGPLRALERIPEEIATLKGLRSVELDKTKVSDLTPLAALTGLQTLWLNQTGVSDLAPLAALTWLQDLRLDQTGVSDLGPIAALTGLKNLSLDQTGVSDLRPIRGARLDGDGLWRGLSFADTPATRLDPELARLAAISNDKDRTRQTLAYLNTLPPWPEPLPWLQGEGQPAEEAADEPPTAQPEPPGRDVRATKEHIAGLIRHATVTRVTARQLAAQIEGALSGVATEPGSNHLPAVLQDMAEVAEVLRAIAPEAEPLTDPLEEPKLRLRIAQLEAALEKLGRELLDERKAREAAEALAKKDGFLQSYKKSAGTALGVASVGLVTVGVPAAGVYFPGADHPFVQSVLTVLGRLPKP